MTREYQPTRTKAGATPAPSVAPARIGLLQRKCTCGGAPGLDGECAGCRKKRLQRQAANQTGPSAAPPVVNEVLRSPGHPLDADTRAYMEPRFGHDFGRVRVHTDARAAESARAVNARAYTVGRDVVFGAGEYAPTMAQGRILLAHELTHTLQQSSMGVGPATHPRMGGVDTQFEREADETAGHISGMMNSATSDVPASVSMFGAIHAPIVQRVCDQPESFYRTSARFCLDTTFSTSTHAGKHCYREIIPEGAEGCPPGDHCCFAPDGTVEDSRDASSLADGKEDDGSCSWDWGCVMKHTLTDFLPAVTGLDCFAACSKVPGPGKFWCLQSCRGRK